MSRFLGVVFAGVLVSAAAGCALDSFLVSFTGPQGKQQVVAGSVDQVSANLQATLGRAGVWLTANRDGDSLRLAGVTRSGKKFTLVLRRQKTDRGESTAVAVEWEKEADEQFWLGVVETLLSPPPPPDSNPGDYRSTPPAGPAKGVR
jgi:hypothetical protein